MTKVVFKKFEDGEVIALFPQEAGDLDPRTMQSYMHVGQHSAAHEDFAQEIELASPEEYADLQAELVRIGYDDLEVGNDITAEDRMAREADLARVV